MNRKTAVITGGSRGIGGAAVKLFAENGYNVVFTYHADRERAECAEKEVGLRGGEASAFRYDAASSEEAKALIEFAAGRYGKVDALVCNAGISFRELAAYTSDEDWQRVIAVNLSGVFYLCRAVISGMLRFGGGAIVNVSSVFGIGGAAAESAYSASKGGVIALTKSLAKELAASGIRVNCVAPGAVDTEMNAFMSAGETAELRAKIPLGRLASPEEVAKTVLFLAESGYITGQVFCQDGGWSGL